jgi:hypothetical protein
VGALPSPGDGSHRKLSGSSKLPPRWCRPSGIQLSHSQGNANSAEGGEPPESARLGNVAPDAPRIAALCTKGRRVTDGVEHLPQDRRKTLVRKEIRTETSVSSIGGGG